MAHMAGLQRRITARGAATTTAPPPATLYNHHGARRRPVRLIAVGAAARTGAPTAAATTAAATATATTATAATATTATTAAETAVAGGTSAASPAEPSVPPPPAPPVRSASGRALDDPARVHASKTARVQLADAGGAVSLAAYMRLPVEQYYILDPNQIAFLGGEEGGAEDGAEGGGGGGGANRFQLTVPRVELFGASLAPVIDVDVDPRPDSVVLSAVRCRLRGGGPLAGLDARSSLRFRTVVTWSSPAPPGPQQQQQQQQQRRGGSSSGSGNSTAAVLTATTEVEVYCEVVPPFQLMPRGALEASCNAVLRRLVATLLPVFLRNLAADYRRWASDAAYRAERAARSSAGGGSGASGGSPSRVQPAAQQAPLV